MAKITELFHKYQFSMQQTLRERVCISGIGIHTGNMAKVTLKPSDPNSGRVFLVNGTAVPALWSNVADTKRSTTLMAQGSSIQTVEHLLSVLYAYNIDNVVIEVEGSELPILDGSGIEWAMAVESAGIIVQDEVAEVCKICHTDEVMVGKSIGKYSPHSGAGLTLEVEVNFDDWPDGSGKLQWNSFQNGMDGYFSGIASARTFAFRKEVDYLLSAGLAKGGSLNNALIITPPAEFSTELRLPQEWIAHKLLDLIGDFALSGVRIEGFVSVYRPGHEINNATVAALRSAQTKCT